jgi:SAM-dependent methyltransferase
MTDVPSPKDQWEQRYGADEYFYGVEPNDFLRASLHQIPKGKVLCLADGEGRNSVFIAEEGYEVSSVDLAEAGIAKTKSLAVSRGVVVDAQVGDLALFDLGTNYWQGIVSIFAHMPQSLRRDLHARVIEALAPGGVFVLEAYTVNQIGRGTGGPQVPELLMSADILQEELVSLEVLHLEELTRAVVEGAGHSGEAAVVQFIGRKR